MIINDLTSIQPYQDQEKIYAFLQKQLVVYHYQESTFRKVCRLSFATYATLVPSILTANSFNPFPGASIISAIAVIITFGTFGADNYFDLSHILFKKSHSGKESLNISNAFKVLISTLSGIASRLPGAGIALKIAPGIPSEWRIPFAILGVIGTCSPEIVSTYNTLEDFGKLCCENDEDSEAIEKCKNEIIQCIQNVKLKLLQLPEEQKFALLIGISAYLTAPQQEGKLKKFFVELLTHKNDEEVTTFEKGNCSRKFIYITIGTVTSLGTCCSLIQNAILTKLAFDFFISKEAIWTWVPSAACALTIAHTTFKTSYIAAKQCFNSGTRLCDGKPSTKFSEIFYPKSDGLASIFSCFWSLALFGIFYESTNSSVGMNHWEGKLLFAGTFIASFFLVYRVIQAVMEKGIFCFARSSWAGKEENRIAQTIEKLDIIEKAIHNISYKKLDSSSVLLDTV